MAVRVVAVPTQTDVLFEGLESDTIGFWLVVGGLLIDPGFQKLPVSIKRLTALKVALK